MTIEFKEKAKAVGAWRSPGDVFYPITVTDDDRPLNKVKDTKKYYARQQQFERLAKQACGNCPVRQDCLFDAVTNDGDQAWGFSGGLTGKQRLDLLEGADLISSECTRCGLTLWGTTGIPPAKICSSLCKRTT